MYTDQFQAKLTINQKHWVPRCSMSVEPPKMGSSDIYLEKKKSSLSGSRILFEVVSTREYPLSQSVSQKTFVFMMSTIQLPLFCMSRSKFCNFA
jgi:hypothetical protein